MGAVNSAIANPYSLIPAVTLSIQASGDPHSAAHRSPAIDEVGQKIPYLKEEHTDERVGPSLRIAPTVAWV
jgi:hypothetical protein